MEPAEMKNQPDVDTSRCNLCGGCIEVCPEVFILNDAAGYIEIADLDEYPEATVNEAINNCPVDCIRWGALG